jgi:hypothetical protein
MQDVENEKLGIVKTIHAAHCTTYGVSSTAPFNFKDQVFEEKK